MAVGTLISLGGNLENPRDSKPSDYSAVGPTGAEGSSSGEGQLVKQSPTQIVNNDIKASDFKVGQSSAAGTSVSCPVSVDLKDGFVVPDVRTKPY